MVPIICVERFDHLWVIVSRGYRQYYMLQTIWLYTGSIQCHLVENCWEIWSPVSNGFRGGYDHWPESQPIDEIAWDLINYKRWCQRGYGHCCLNDILDGWWSTMSSSGQLCWWHCIEYWVMVFEDMRLILWRSAGDIGLDWQWKCQLIGISSSKTQVICGFAVCQNLQCNAWML